MTDNEIQLRMTALNMAIASKEWDTQPDDVVARAMRYLAFLKGTAWVVKVARAKPPARRKK